MPAQGKFQKKETPRAREERILQLFRSLDTQHKGYVDRDALQEGFHRLNHPLEHADGITREVIALVDQNGDGIIQFEEFKLFVEKTEQHLWALFNAIDKDKNGRLDKGEVAAALATSGLSVPSAKLEHFFDSMDRDNDGAISFEDWRDFLLFIPLDNVSIRAAYRYFFDSLPLTSEGDVVLSDDTLGGIGYFVSGGVAGAVSRTSTAPFDRLKVYLIAQTNQVATDTAKKAAVAAITGEVKAGGIVRGGSPLLDAIKTIWRHGGIKNFFVGNGLNVLKIFPESAMKFGSFEASKRALAQLEGTSVNEMSGISSFLAGGIGGAVSQFAVYPVDTLKFRVQCEAEFSELRGNALLLKTAKNMWQNGGLSCYYRGLALGIGGIFPFAALDLGTFEAMKRAYVKTRSKQHGIEEGDVKLGSVIVLTMGAISGSVGASVVYPINVLRTRLQAQGTAAHPQTYAGMMDVLRKTIKLEGYRGLFRGLVPNLAKVAPSVSISYLVYENCKSVMGLE
ncbi:mitochondrial carrier domain-containing protein [Lipomyces tetrasporus]|uniref:Mitochondrial carrier domain-containing protein n=1 Tax=Lipomyces tetrasporus TaxID=54092 RepID=A0AAD7QNI3_9ASCO|nr:mitochondrial carrier domain-containing protein [Lipomyces tetrasporus]KAJ8098313.1 mitochondrial carrier domain-containing protein [Lipomyces tetrasporus]